MASYRFIIAISLVLFVKLIIIEANEQLIDYYDELGSNEIAEIEEIGSNKHNYQNAYEKRFNPSKTRVVNEKEMINDLVNKLKNMYVVSSRPRFGKRDDSVLVNSLFKNLEKQNAFKRVWAEKSRVTNDYANKLKNIYVVSGRSRFGRRSLN